MKYVSACCTFCKNNNSVSSSLSSVPSSSSAVARGGEICNSAALYGPTVNDNGQPSSSFDEAGTTSPTIPILRGKVFGVVVVVMSDDDMNNDDDVVTVRGGNNDDRVVVIVGNNVDGDIDADDKILLVGDPIHTLPLLLLLVVGSKLNAPTVR